MSSRHTFTEEAPDGGWTNVLVQRRHWDDYGPVPTPVHAACWNTRGRNGGYERVIEPGFFQDDKGNLIEGRGIQDETIHCHLCGEKI